MREGGRMGNDTRLITVALLTTVFLVALDVSVVSTAMPTVISQLGGLGLYAWVFSAYLLTSTVTVPIYGKLADLYGRKPVFFGATTIFLVGSMLCGQSQSMEQLILFRVIQGVGAGGVFPVTTTIIGDVFSLEQRAQIMGVFSSVWGISALLGPAIGGFLTEQVSWRLVFYVNLPFGLLSILLVGWLFHEQVERRAHKVDYAGAALLSAAVTLLLFGVQNGTAPERRVVSMGLVLAATASFALFVRQERRAAEPILPLDLFGQRLIGSATMASFLVGVVLFIQGSFVPPFVQGVMGASPTVGGFILSATSLGWPAASFIAAQVMLRWGYRLTSVIGSLFLIVGWGLQALVLRPTDSLVLAGAIQAVLGAGFGFLSPPLLVAMQNAVPWEQRGVVTSVSQFARTIGGTIGVSVAGLIFVIGMQGAVVGADPNAMLSEAGRATLSPDRVQELRGELASALRPVYLASGGLGLLTLLVSFLLPGGNPEQYAWKPSEPTPEAPPPRKPVVAQR